jgi:hypothetical protein
MSTLTTTLSLSRLVVRNRLAIRLCSSQSTTQDGKPKIRSVSIGGLTKQIKEPKNPELVPTKYLPKDDEIPKETLKVKLNLLCCLETGVRLLCHLTVLHTRAMLGKIMKASFVR